MHKNKFLLCTLLTIPSAASADDGSLLDFAIKAAITTGITISGTYLANVYLLPKNQSALDDKYRLASIAAKALGEKGRHKISNGSYSEKIEGFIETKVADEMLSLAIVDVELSYIEEQRKLDETYCDYRDKKTLLERRKEIVNRLADLNSKEYRDQKAEQAFRNYVQSLQNHKNPSDNEHEKQSTTHESTVSQLRQHAQPGTATAN